MNPTIPLDPNQQPPEPAPEHRRVMKFQFEVVGDGSTMGQKLVARGSLNVPNWSAALCLLSQVVCGHPQPVETIVLQRQNEGRIILPPGRG